MSVTVDYFFNFPAPLAEVGEAVGRALGVRFEPYIGESSDLFCRFLSMEFSLQRHSLENDRECTFEEFEFLLGTRTPTPDGDLRSFQVEAMVIVAYLLGARGAIDMGLLVFDTQKVLARYVAAPDHNGLRQMRDLVSGKLVRLPEHFVDVASRIPGTDWRT